MDRLSTWALPSGLQLVLALASGCSSSGTQDARIELQSFELNECKSEHSPNTLLTNRQTADYAGLACVAWDFTDENAPKIDLINREVGCGFQGHDRAGATKLWRPSSFALAGDRLKVEIQWNFEAPSACGNCLDDFSLSLEKFDFAGLVALDIATRDCTDDCNWTSDRVKLQLERDPSGILCRYLERYGFGTEVPLGKLHRPATSAGACDDDLVALSRENKPSVCVAACSEDSDCPLPDVLGCRDGMCQLTRALEQAPASAP